MSYFDLVVKIIWIAFYLYLLDDLFLPILEQWHERDNTDRYCGVLVFVMLSMFVLITLIS